MKLKTSTVLLQSQVRGLLARRRFSEHRSRDEAARKIQLVWRATKLAREERIRFINMKKSVVIIQSLVRRNSALKLADRLRHERDVIIQRNKAASLIQV